MKNLMDGRAVTRGAITRQARLGGMAVAEARHPAGFELPLHAHPVACATTRGEFAPFCPADAAHANRYGETGAVSFVLTFASRATSALSDEAGSLARVRLLRSAPAAAAIRSTDRPLSSVALEFGFSDQSHMTRQFRRYLGVTPGALRGA